VPGRVGGREVNPKKPVLFFLEKRLEWGKSFSSSWYAT